MEMNRNRTIFELVLILSGAFLTLIFLYMSKPYRISGVRMVSAMVHKISP